MPAVAGFRDPYFEHDPARLPEGLNARGWPCGIELTAACEVAGHENRAPATGLWEAPSGETVRDQVVVYEVMVEVLDAEWWGVLRVVLEARFAQQELVLRAQAIQRL